MAQNLPNSNQQQTANEPPKAWFPLVLAWVLLSGSGAGNLYLFWSYLDVRKKYQGAVRQSARSISDRLHAA